MEIESSELRLGNLILHELFGTVEVISIYKNSYDISRNGKSKEWFVSHDCKGIPLTEDWLLKLGFNKDYKQGYIGIDVNNSDFVLTEPLVIGEWQTNYVFQFNAGNLSKFTELKYVHQLQNLFFTITGKELELI